MGRPPFRLSVGEKRKIALATAIAMKPNILLVDEPTANLDPASADILIETLNTLNREYGTTLVVATQDVDVVPHLSDRVYILSREKRIAAEGATKEIISNAELLEAHNLKPPTILRLLKELKEGGIEVNANPPTAKAVAQELLKILSRQRSKRDN